MYIYSHGDPDTSKAMSEDINNGHTLIPFNHLLDEMTHQYTPQSYTEYKHWNSHIDYSYGTYFYA